MVSIYIQTSDQEGITIRMCKLATPSHSSHANKVMVTILNVRRKVFLLSNEQRGFVKTSDELHFYSSETAKVRVNNALSDQYSAAAGVRQ